MPSLNSVWNSSAFRMPQLFLYSRIDCHEMTDAHTPYLYVHTSGSDTSDYWLFFTLLRMARLNVYSVLTCMNHSSGDSSALLLPDLTLPHLTIHLPYLILLCRLSHGEVCIRFFQTSLTKEYRPSDLTQHCLLDLQAVRRIGHLISEAIYAIARTEYI